MKIGFVPRSTAFCAMLAVIAITMDVLGWLAFTPSTALGMYCIALMCAVWAYRAWPQDTPYIVELLIMGKVEIITATLPTAWDNVRCCVFIQKHTSHEVLSLEPLTEVKHCPSFIHHGIGNY